MLAIGAGLVWGWLICAVIMPPSGSLVGPVVALPGYLQALAGQDQVGIGADHAAVGAVGAGDQAGGVLLGAGSGALLGEPPQAVALSDLDSLAGHRGRMTDGPGRN